MNGKENVSDVVNRGIIEVSVLKVGSILWVCDGHNNTTNTNLGKVLSLLKILRPTRGSHKPLGMQADQEHNHKELEMGRNQERRTNKQ